jgi:hypothetical protein
MLSGVIIGYKWAFRELAEFASDVNHLLGPSSMRSNDNEEKNNWYANEFNQIFDAKKSLLMALVFTVIAIIIGFEINLAEWFPNRLSRTIGFIFYTLIGTAFGACVWPGHRMSVFVYALAKRIGRINPFMPSNVGIFKIARTFIKFEAVGILLILVFGAAFEMSPYRLSNRLILSAATVVSVVWAFWFYFTQSQIHYAMVRYKNEMQSRFAQHYERRLSMLLKHPKPQAFQELERLIVLKKEIESIPVWPFNIRSLLTSVGLVATPIFAALAQRLLGH